MKLTVIGCAGSFPAPDTPCSAYLVEAGGFRLLIDFGTGSLGELQKYVDPHLLDAVIVTHLHPDHFFDTCAYAVMRRYAPARPEHPLPLFGPAGVADRIVSAYGGQGELCHPLLRDVYDFRELRPGAFALGPLTVIVDRVAHPVETFGVRVEHAGSSLAYSSDTGPCAALETLAAHCDILLAEASYLEGRENPKDVHLTGKEAGDYATKAGAGRLLLTHLVEPWGSRQDTLAEARAAYTGPVEVVRPGQVYEF
ncbi:MBL fold metallo-hydrolase [Glycomyces sp. L485]|uniref:MBL fold metallo-hydrolase n=1 Tax=Glycomyces sp. L485 TaxID=2909235 RepID=UPI001F4A6C66|nr:MBL fold metallo-hydrolase [Glycomyces sp. L485]MCH7232040.1 MBL fold metallo-hydrolase [Glycomyces sp. L485]